MNVTPSVNQSSTDATNTPTSSTSAASPSQLNGSDFMTLLLTQLKSQDPLQPMDPSEFVGQLVQLNSLNELIGIHQILQQDQTATGTSTTPSAPTQGA